MASITFDRVRKAYPDGFIAVAGLDLQVRDGEFMVFVGPSGCGKTTVLRMVAGLEDVTAGTLTIGDRVANTLQPQDRDIAMVFQDYALYPHMTVRQNMGFALRMMKMPKAEVARRVERAADQLSLRALLDKRPRHLSGGQRQRVAMGRAIVREPAVFLMDEPLSNLDAKLRVQMRAEIAALQRELGITTIYVTHDQVEAMTMGHRVAVLKEGHLQQVATPQDLYDNPVNVFVAAFMGSPKMNLFHSVLRRTGEGAAFAFGETWVPVAPEVLGRRPGLQRRPEGAIIVGVRPEGLSLAEAGAATDGLAVHVSLVEALGNETLVYFSAPVQALPDVEHPDASLGRQRAGDGPGAVSSTLVARLSPPRPIREGAVARCTLDPTQAYFFDLEGSAI